MNEEYSTKIGSFAFALTLFGAVGVLASACGGENPAPATPPVNVAKAAPSRDEGLAAYQVIDEVMRHPRCRNCHPGGDEPLQGDEGRVHDMNVKRGPTGAGNVGEECTTCHGVANAPTSYGEHSPPGESKPWHMPPPDTKMIVVGTSAGALCEQIKDPNRNGHKDMKALREHWDDPLVVWGWDPGLGRKPVPVPHDKLVAAFETWRDAGAPCPPP